MQRFVPSETALVLGGGGAKGAYQIGVIDALHELGIQAGSAFGTSIGALNAALYAQDGAASARTLWESIRLSDVVTPESMELAEEAEAMFSRADKLLEFITRNAQKKGVDPAPLLSTIREHVHEDALRTSGTRFGLVVTRFPSLSMVEKPLTAMREGTLHSWLMASCACFPALPMAHAEGERYLDGGFSDNVPIEMAIRAGARRIIAVDIGKNRAHTQYDRRPNITYIRASHPLGGLLSFDPERARRNIRLGYNDAMRTFGRLRGTRFSFDPIDSLLLSRRADDFVCMLSAYEADVYARRDSAPLFSLLEEELRPGADAVDYYLRACELCMETLGLDPVPVYTHETLISALRAALPLEQAKEMLGSLLGGRIGVLFAPPQPDRRVVLACLYHLMQSEGSLPPLAMHTLTAFPRELLCALTLSRLL